MISFFNTPSSSNYVTEKEETLEESQIRHCETGSLFGAEFGKLPNGRFLLINRAHFQKYEENADGVYGYAKAEFDLSADTWFFAHHFHGDPVMPGCLGLDAMWQLVGFWLGWSGSPGRGRALGVGEVKFTGQVTPDIKKVRYEIELKRVIRRRLVLGIADGRMYADDELIYKATDLKVGLFIPENTTEGAV